MSLNFSFYTVLHIPDSPSGEHPGKVLLWNTLTGAFRAYEGECGEAVRSVMSTGRTDYLSEELRRDLSQDGFLIRKEQDELSILEDELFAVSSGSSEYTGNFFRILTTTRCNAACPYCYERGIPVQEMSTLTAKDTAAFINERSCGEFVILEWFGGEPLLNTAPVTLICEELEASGIPFISRITTNGSLWTAELVETACHIWNLKSAQITLDGIGEDHERDKGLPSGSFQRTIDSVHNLTKAGIRVQLRIIHYAGREQRPLAEWIAAEFRSDPLVGAYAAPGYTAGTEHSAHLMREVLALNTIFVRNGFWGNALSILPRRRHIGCYSVSPLNYTITPEGDLCDCAHDPHSIYGSVRKQVEPKAQRAFIRDTFSPACRACRLLPVCQGGCRVAELGSAPMTRCIPEKNIVTELMELQDSYRREYEKGYG